MKKKMLSVFLTVLAICFVLPGISANANVKEDTDEVKPYMKVYDEKNNLIESYDEEEFEQFYVNDINSIGIGQKSLYAIRPAKVYPFGKTSFTYNIWVNGGSSFYDLKSIVINPARKINKIFIGVYHGSTQARVVEVGGFSSGINIPLGTSNSSTRFHRIQLVNGDQHAPISISSGSVYYDVQ